MWLLSCIFFRLDAKHLQMPDLNLEMFQNLLQYCLMDPKLDKQCFEMELYKFFRLEPLHPHNLLFGWEPVI